MIDQAQKTTLFRELHHQNEPLLIPNPWDIGTARLLAHAGFSALATTSLGVGIMLGQKQVSMDDTLENVRQICAATDLPVNADLENGFANDPKEAAKCVALAYECGAVGASIEDFSADPAKPIYDFNHAVERVAAAVETAHSFPEPMVFTARAENLLYGINDLDNTIRRLQAFEKAGADVLYAPGLRDLEQIKTVVSSVSKPFNVVMGFADPSITLDQLAQAGVKRVSIGGGLSRLAMSAFLTGAKQMQAGDFTFVRQMAPLSDLFPAFE